MDSSVNITIANSNQHSKVDLGTSTLTTLNWFTMKPVHFQEVIPGGKYDIDISGELQMLALHKPMFSNIRCLTRSFFVPYRIIFPHWNAFITDTREKNRKFTSVPSFDVLEFLCKFNKDTTLVTRERILEDANITERYDYICRDGELGTNNSTVYETYGYKFTKKGRRIYDILVGLGYNFNFGFTYDPNSILSQFNETDFGHVSALAIMAYAKVVQDWFTLPSYQDKINTIGAALDTIAEQSNQTTVLNNIFIILGLCIDLHYMDDIFVSAWDNPNSPNDAAASQTISIVDVTNNSTDAQSRMTVSNPINPNVQTYFPTNGTPVMNGGSSRAVNNVTQYILNALQKLSSFTRRNQLVGYRPLDRYLARYGKKLSSEQLLRSVVLGETRFNIEIDPVLSTADTVGQAANMTLGTTLGDKAGQGYGTTRGKIHFEAEEFGILITVCYVLPYVKYYQGLNPMNMRMELTDFYQPEFDGLGCAPIPAKTLLSSSMNSWRHWTPSSNENPLNEDTRYPLDQVFGWAPRYYNYKTNPYATVSGDFRFNSRNVGMEQWHLFRKIFSTVNYQVQPQGLNLESYNWKHNQRFTEGSSDDNYYNRIFQLDDGENDGFIVGFNFDVDANLPVRPLYDDNILNSDPDSEHKEQRDFQVGGSRLV